MPHVDDARAVVECKTVIFYGVSASLGCIYAFSHDFAAWPQTSMRHYYSIYLRNVIMASFADAVDEKDAESV